MISVVILTYNDEVQIAACLESARAISDDVVCVDSFSTDRTVEICRAWGARVYQNPFVNQAIQFNWALDNVPLRYDWVLRLDSDEVVPPALRREILDRVGKEPDVVAYEINRAVYWMGRKLRWGRMYPHYIVRLFRKDRGRYELRTEEHLVIDGPVARLRNEFYEDNKKNTLAYFTEKHLATARGEVAEFLSGVDSAAPGERAVRPRLFGTKVERTRWLKERLYNRLPLFVRPFLYFLYRYVVCLGFLDGRPGLVFHVLQGFWYRFYIDACIFEARLAQRAHAVGAAAAPSREGEHA
ncbi:MAG: glycosyltransferase family 2 protein [Geminicoccaceae bacterium]|nr:glycosyltransferase family 2 protein [Geminicoccaceae bacterium]MDW8342714.1 glycosyltransferase family 2 protein [Geminicoccaceae bacterium]